MKIERLSVESSNIVSMGYDAESQQLEVEFRSGIYRYGNVPPETWDELQEAPSKGSFIARVIRPGFEAAKLAYDPMLEEEEPVEETVPEEHHEHEPDDESEMA